MGIVHNSQQLINRVTVQILKGGVTHPPILPKKCQKLPVQNFELGRQPHPPCSKRLRICNMKIGICSEIFVKFSFLCCCCTFQVFGQNSQFMKLSTVIMSDHIKFIYPAQPQKLVLGPICQGGDRKIKRRD